jgi:mono/diheme cytochrome c family protein
MSRLFWQISRRAFGALAIAAVMGNCAVERAWAAAADPVTNPQPPNDALVTRGKYLATVGDCISCHTAEGGTPFSGGRYLPTPFGDISTPNITPDKTTGIGDWSDDDFYRAMHEGLGRHHEYLYPVFPFPWFTKVTRDDVMAIKAFLFSLPPAHAPRKSLKLAFPFNIRECLLAWRIAFFKPGTFAPDPHQTAQLNRGAYLVEGLGHCGECHNRHRLFGASDWSGKLEGGEIEGWYAPSLTEAGQDSIAAWSDEQIAHFLKTGADPKKGVALGPMRETIGDSLSHLADGDLAAMATYIKTATANKPTKSSHEAAPPTRRGGEVFLSSCAFCHQPNGQGIPGMIPALAGNAAVNTEGPENVIRVVLGGLEASHGLGPMPAVGQNMSDGDIAAVVNYVRTSWGNNAPADAQAGNVADLRTKTRTMLSGNRPDGCPPIPNPALSSAVAAVRDQLSGVTPADMLTRVDTIVSSLKASGASDDDIVNALTVGYCSVVTSHDGSPAQRAVLLGDFSVLVYGQIKNKNDAKPN